MAFPCPAPPIPAATSLPRGTLPFRTSVTGKTLVQTQHVFRRTRPEHRFRAQWPECHGRCDRCRRVSLQYPRTRTHDGCQWRAPRARRRGRLAALRRGNLFRSGSEQWLRRPGRGRGCGVSVRVSSGWTVVTVTTTSVVVDASLPLRQRGPLLRIHAPAPFVRPCTSEGQDGG